MPLSSFLYTDDVDDVLAAHINRVTQSTLRGELGSASAITTQTALTDGDFPFLKLTPNANLDVLLPPEASTNHVHVIENGSGTYTLTVKEDSDTTTISTIGPNGVAMFIPSVGTAWKAIKPVTVPAASERITTAIDGLNLIWNSATSISVGVGACYAENGDWIDVTSAITKASLSLSNSTWYHIYVYLSAGVASAEVVTTAPVAWKGTAYSKTSDTSRRYVGSILTDGSGNVKKFIHNVFDNSMRYMKFQFNATPHRVLSSGTAATATAVALTTIIPVTASIPYVRIASTADQGLYTGDDNGVGASQLTTSLVAGNTITQSTILFHPIDGSQQIWYIYGAAVGAGGANIDVLGYQYKR
jgi:hypothetical protein